MAWQGWSAPWLWVSGCGLLLLVLVLLVSPRSCRARRTLRGLFMARSKRLLFRIGLVPGSGDGMRGSGRRARRGVGTERQGSGGGGPRVWTERGLGRPEPEKRERRGGLEKPLTWGN